MKPMSKQHPNAGFANVESTGKVKKCNWKDRLILRRYRFPASGESEQDLATRIDHAGMGYFFPLGTPDMETGAAKAAQIYQMAVKQGWNSVFQHFPRELIVSFEWCMNPVLWTYTTIHTLVGKRAGLASDSLPANPNRQRVLVVELSLGQFVEDVRLAVEGRCPVDFMGHTGGMLFNPEQIADRLIELAR